MTSRQRVKCLLDGKLPDRPPLYDVVRNDAVLEHFGEEELTRENAPSAVCRAHSRALDATKSGFRLPNFDAGKSVTDTQGRQHTPRRWTSWSHRVNYGSTEEYVLVKTEATADPWGWTEEDRKTLDSAVQKWVDLDGVSGDLIRDFHFPGPPRLDNIFPEVGLEEFSYYMADCPDILQRQIAFRFEKIVQAVEATDLPPEVIIVSEACDIAYKSGLIFPPDFLKKSFIPGYSRFCDGVHKKGFKVLFHSDGNLMEILDDLVDAGIDLLHPLEPLAGMDPGEIHRRYPDLLLLGTIDVSQLLPFGTEGEIRDQVNRNIEAAEGRIMIGSSTEVHNVVPLKNYLALHETALNYRF